MWSEYGVFYIKIPYNTIRCIIRRIIRPYFYVNGSLVARAVDGQPNQRNRMLNRTGERATRYFCNRRFKDNLERGDWEKKYGDWTDSSGKSMVNLIACLMLLIIPTIDHFSRCQLGGTLRLSIRY